MKKFKITLPIVFEKFNSTFVVDRGNSIAVDEISVFILLEK